MLLITASALSAKHPYPPAIENAQAYTYKSTENVELNLWVFTPETSSESAPAMLFFFGGGWNTGSPLQFLSQAQHLARRGMVGIVVDYRVKTRHGVVATNCVEDAYDALLYVEQNADSLGIDPSRIAVGGGSAGGHLAACLGTLHVDHGVPAAMALYNPATVLAPLEYDAVTSWLSDQELQQINQRLEARQAELSKRLGVEPEALSPFHHVNQHSPPTIIFHGTEDRTIPYISSAIFAKRLQAHNVDVHMKKYEAKGHGFYNKEPYLSQTTSELDQFLVSLGWLK